MDDCAVTVREHPIRYAPNSTILFLYIFTLSFEIECKVTANPTLFR